MILLAAGSCLLFFIMYFTGIAAVQVIKKFTSINVVPDFFEVFMAGLTSSFVYFNVLSFFLPVNFISLLPLLLTSLYVFSIETVRRRFFAQLQQAGRLFFTKKNLPFTLPLLILLFIYWIIPPLNADSGEYHYIAIRWYEQFRVVPGLANVHGRLAFNPASFVISAAYSFTALAGQAVYPLNGVLVLLFYTWLLKKFFTGSGYLYLFILLVLAILLFRIALINISSPSSDLLCGILLFYGGFRTFELLDQGYNALEDYLSVIIIACFSVTAKLTAVPALLIVPFIYFFVVRTNKRPAAVWRSILLLMLIIIPWLSRNFIMSGYLLYPVRATGFLPSDWKVPDAVIQLDFLFSKYGPRTITVDFFSMQKMNSLQLVTVWYNYMRASSISSLLITCVSFLSITAWILFPLLKKAIPHKPFLLWCLYYFCVAVWFFNSPEHRFGLPYLLLCAGLPLLLLAKKTAGSRVFAPLSYIVFLLCVLHYAMAPFKMNGMYAFSLGDCWLKPLRDHRYLRSNDSASFSFVELGNGIKLYIPDSDHECLNASGPCMNWRYGVIELRGKRIQDGFRNKTDEVKKYFPFVDSPVQP